MKTRKIITPLNMSAVAWGILSALAISGSANAEPVAGGTLDPNTIPKYVTPLVIPPVMKNAGTADDYDIAVRQFQQQILPGGLWDTLGGTSFGFPATPIWSYGPAAEDRIDVSNLVAPSPASQFNYPSYTIEATANVTTTVDWVNDLVDPLTENFRQHLLPVDRTLHWANPEGLVCDAGKIKDCRPDPLVLNDPSILQQPYDGPVPIVTHVHGAHVGPESDGYPEAWWLPDANDIPGTYSTTGTLANGYGVQTNGTAGIASFTYPNTQPSTTLWYHDHTLGMTRNNVYAGPAGFWLIREAGGGESGLKAKNFTLPGPAPVAGDTVLELNAPGLIAGTLDKRTAIREIPIVIQDRAFNTDGSLFYPANRAFFEGLGDGQQSGPTANAEAGLVIDTIGSGESDIAPMWNPEAFFNVMVVNGVSWPNLDVEQDLYRFRLLNGCNSRFINLALMATLPDGSVQEIPFYQIGAEQSLLPNVVKVATGVKTALPGGGKKPKKDVNNGTAEALLMGLAERADVLVDFSGLPAGTEVIMINTAPDAPFGGFPDVPADPATTGQVMKFTVTGDTAAGEGFTAPIDLEIQLPDRQDPAYRGKVATVRDLALLEEESSLICATSDPAGNIAQDPGATPDGLGNCVDADGLLAMSLPFGPKAAVLGTNGAAGGAVQLWSDPIRQQVGMGATEQWELWNWSADAHPIHLHLVKFKVVDRQPFDVVTGALLAARPAELTEQGWKDTVISYPGEVTRVNATFDIPGLYVWHCHIVEHEDNEMMVPFCVENADGSLGAGCDLVPTGGGAVL